MVAAHVVDSLALGLRDALCHGGDEVLRFLAESHLDVQEGACRWGRWNEQSEAAQKGAWKKTWAWKRVAR